VHRLRHIRQRELDFSLHFLTAGQPLEASKKPRHACEDASDQARVARPQCGEPTLACTGLLFLLSADLVDLFVILDDLAGRSVDFDLVLLAVSPAYVELV